MTAVFLVLGLALGLFSFAGVLGLIEALIVLGLVLFRVQRFPERAGAYLFGMSVLPVALLGNTIVRAPACGQAASGAPCYQPIVPIALAAFAAAGLAGAVLLGIALRRLFGLTTASRST